ncbi:MULTISPECIES: hypothetical protein [Xanthomonas]|uniref:hypothetical protein n=1 Tax=Xanthomonas TaxID=338 RepID=UPI001ADBAFFF|nr:MULTISPECIES: hypothetical protein [unclassified Xanthomonas]MBO9873944.1 hypothetical protein [Xanthomonas sp. D-93]WNH43842.1 hypothetical protein PG878_15125 [Xanthomonas sp. A6251]
MYKQVKFTREELYEMVWARPVLVLAKEIGVSDVALSKACRKAGIPLPNRGHWAIVRTGRTVKQPPLPDAKEGQPSVVHFTVAESSSPKPPRPEVPLGPPVAVPQELIKPHRLIAEVKAAAKAAQEDKGVLQLNYHKVLRLRTSTAQLPRALILLDVLIKQFEAKGCKVRINDERASTELVLKEGTVSFRLSERTKQTPPPPPPPRPPGRRGESYYEPWRPAYILVGTGEFALEFDQWLGNSRHIWKDRAGNPLEAQLHEVIAEVPVWEDALRTRRLENEKRAADAREQEARHIEAERVTAVLRTQRARLVHNMLAWERAERIRHFILAVEQSADPTPQAQAWLAWANEQVECLDPIASSLSNVINLDVKLDPYFSGYSHWNKPEKDWWD